MKITVFVHSLGHSHNPDRQVHNTSPYYGMAVEQTFVEMMDWDSCLYSDDDRKILNTVCLLPDVVRRDVNIVDIAQLRGCFRAWRAGIFNSPAVLVNGRRQVGFNAVMGVLSALLEKV